MKAAPARDFYREVVLKFTGDECLVWPFTRNRGGYAVTYVKRWPYFVCRLALEELVGPPPTDKHEAAHSCGKGSSGCVNPGHLYWATRLKNEEDKLKHGTRVCGSRHGESKLTEDQVIEIFRLKKTETNLAISKMFGVGTPTISKILNGKSWVAVSSLLPEDAKQESVHRHTEVRMNLPFYPCGHPRTEENTRVVASSGAYRCRECLRALKRRQWSRSHHSEAA